MPAGPGQQQGFNPPRHKPRSKTLRVLAPLLVVIPYIAYVLHDRFEDHHRQREELDNARIEAKQNRLQNQSQIQSKK